MILIGSPWRHQELKCTCLPQRAREDHGVSKVRNVFYIGTSLEHYRYFNGWHPKTRSVQGSETVLFKHKYTTAPMVTPADAIIQAAKELEDAIKKYLHLQPKVGQIDRLKECTKIFGPIFHNNKGGRGEYRSSEGGHQGRWHICEGGKGKQVQRTNMAANRLKKQHVS